MEIGLYMNEGRWKIRSTNISEGDELGTVNNF